LGDIVECVGGHLVNSCVVCEQQWARGSALPRAAYLIMPPCGATL
jgi:hypothetical protein